MKGGKKNLRFLANAGIHALDMALGVVSSEFVRTGPSHMHRCCTLSFALAELFCLYRHNPETFVVS